MTYREVLYWAEKGLRADQELERRIQGAALQRGEERIAWDCEERMEQAERKIAALREMARAAEIAGWCPADRSGREAFMQWLEREKGISRGQVRKVDADYLEALEREYQVARETEKVQVLDGESFL